MRHEIEPTLNIWSISILAAFRNLDGNDLTELTPGIFDSLTLLTFLYVLSPVAETSLVSFFFLLEPDIVFLSVRLGPARCSWIEPLLYRWAWQILLHLATQLSSAEGWSQSSSSSGQWGMRLYQPWILCRFHFFFVIFRGLGDNRLTELLPGFFDSLDLLTSLYVLWLVTETSFVSCLFQPDIFFFSFVHLGPARCS